MTTFNIEDFRKAAIVARKVNGNNAGLDIRPIEKVIVYLTEVTRGGVEGFCNRPVHERCILRSGGQRLGMKFLNDDTKLYHLLSTEIIGNARRITQIDERRLDRTARFFEGVAHM